ncbi:hypothetical protein P3342_001327 [Pyrenophora teres f. teres]|nr:hypothetical protein P3342_001327 [Pyrenophora teres f. teres]
MDHRHSEKRRKIDPEEYTIAPRPRFRKPNQPASLRAHTPRNQEDGDNPKQKSFDGPEPLEDPDLLDLDRDWYGGEENGHTFGDDTQPFRWCREHMAGGSTGGCFDRQEAK